MFKTLSVNKLLFFLRQPKRRGNTMKFNWLKRSFQTRNNQSGRSMTEMVGVLILIGILSMGALGGYGWTMDKYRSNTLSREVLQRAAEIKTQLDRRHRDISLNKFDDKSLIGYWIGLEPGTPKTENNTTIVGIQVDKVPERVCRMAFDGNIGLFDIKVGNSLYPKKTDTDTSNICSAENTMIFYIDDAWEYDRNKAEICPDGRMQCSNNSDCDQVAGEQCIDSCCQSGTPNCGSTSVCSSDYDCTDDEACIGGCCKEVIPNTCLITGLASCSSSDNCADDEVCNRYCCQKVQECPRGKTKCAALGDPSRYTCCSANEICSDATCYSNKCEPDEYLCSDGCCSHECLKNGSCNGSSSGSSSSGGTSGGSCDDLPNCGTRACDPGWGYSGIIVACCSDGGDACRNFRGTAKIGCTVPFGLCVAKQNFCSWCGNKCKGRKNMQYNAAANTCECMAGYVLEGSECVSVATTQVLYTSETETVTATPGVSISSYPEETGSTSPDERYTETISLYSSETSSPFGSETSTPLTASTETSYGTETSTMTVSTGLTETSTMTISTGLTETPTMTVSTGLTETSTMTTSTGITATTEPATLLSTETTMMLTETSTPSMSTETRYRTETTVPPLTETTAPAPTTTTRMTETTAPYRETVTQGYGDTTYNYYETISGRY